jgi:hypothetical protein
MLHWTRLYLAWEIKICYNELQQLQVTNANENAIYDHLQKLPIWKIKLFDLSNEQKDKSNKNKDFRIQT